MCQWFFRTNNLELQSVSPSPWACCGARACGYLLYNQSEPESSSPFLVQVVEHGPVFRGRYPRLAASADILQRRGLALFGAGDGRTWGVPGRLPVPGQYAYEGLQVTRYEQGQHFLAHEVRWGQCGGLSRDYGRPWGGRGCGDALFCMGSKRWGARLQPCTASAVYVRKLREVLCGSWEDGHMCRYMHAATGCSTAASYAHSQLFHRNNGWSAMAVLACVGRLPCAHGPPKQVQPPRDTAAGAASAHASFGLGISPLLSFRPRGCSPAAGIFVVCCWDCSGQK